MKPSILNILFSKHGVFSVLPEWHERLNEPDYKLVGEQLKANAIRIENPKLLKRAIEYYCSKCKGFGMFNGVTCSVCSGSGISFKYGDIFQVDGFEYDVLESLPPKALLRLAKEEKQEPDIQTSDIHHTFNPHGQFKTKEEEPKEQPDEALEGLTAQEFLIKNKIIVPHRGEFALNFSRDGYIRSAKDLETALEEYANQQNEKLQMELSEAKELLKSLYWGDKLDECNAFFKKYKK